MVDAGKTIRFLGRSTSGLSSSSWRVWTSRNHRDIYVAPRHLAGSIKVSLHESGTYQTSFLNMETAAKWEGPEGTRHMDRWERPAEFAPGWVRVFEVILPESEMRNVAEPDLATTPHVALPVGPGYAVHVTIFEVQLGPVDVTMEFTDALHVATMTVGKDARVVVMAILLPWDAGSVLPSRHARAP